MPPRNSTDVLMVESGGWGGLGHYAYNLCQALAGVGCRVTLVTGSPYELRTLPRGFVLDACIPGDATYVQKLKRLAGRIRTSRPRLLHIQSTFGARRDWVGLIVLKLLGYPIVLTAHDVVPHDAPERNALGMHFSFRVIYALCDRIVVHSEAIRRQLIERFKTTPSRLTVIPHGDYTFAGECGQMDAAEAKRWLGIPVRDRLVLAFGAIREYKGVPDLIDAFAEVADAMPDVRLAIVGKPIGVDPEVYRSQIRETGLESRVLLRAEYVPFHLIARYFQAAHIAVFPYRSASQSGALQLAYAFAKPVVVTRVGALPETVMQGDNGLVVPPAEPAALAKALLRLLSMDEPDLLRMGQRSLELAETRHSWEDIAHKTTALYGQVLSRSAR